MAYKQQKIISHSPRGWEVQDHDTGRLSVIAGEDPLPGSLTVATHSVLHGGRIWGNLSTVSVVRASVPLRRALPLWLNHPPKASLSNTNTLEVKFQCKDLEDTVALNPGSPNSCPSCMKNTLHPSSPKSLTLFQHLFQHPSVKYPLKSLSQK